MEKTLLIAGKDLSSGSDFASGAALHNRTAVLTTRAPEADVRNGYQTVTWNRTSSISARTAVLSCVNKTTHLDEVVLEFDECRYATRFVTLNSSEIEVALDEMVLGYQYLTQELISKFKQHKFLSPENKYAKIAFLHKTNTTLADTVASGSKASSSTASHPLVAAASAAFKAFAENVAASLLDSDCILPVLVLCDQNNELSRRDNALAVWLCEYFDSLDDPKKRPNNKQLVNWIKAGAKKSSFSWFS